MLTTFEFYDLLARFNQKNADFIYKLEGPKVIPRLLQFFAEEAKNR